MREKERWGVKGRRGGVEGRRGGVEGFESTPFRTLLKCFHQLSY